MFDSKVPAKTRYIYFLTDAKDLHDYGTRMPLQGKYGGLAPEKKLKSTSH